ncbi:MAG: hypothetical protein LLG15_10350 [Betaproteobacteria bacterium]|nr:hypothetical protein [Betaproteobacteria bacterium]
MRQHERIAIVGGNRRESGRLFLVELSMLMGAKELTMANDAFAPRQIDAAMDATHHILADHIR